MCEEQKDKHFFFFKAEPLAGWAGPGKLGGAESQFVGVESF